MGQAYLNSDYNNRSLTDPSLWVATHKVQNDHWKHSQKLITLNELYNHRRSQLAEFNLYNKDNLWLQPNLLIFRYIRYKLYNRYQ
jgi:hypothetical protein